MAIAKIRLFVKGIVLLTVFSGSLVSAEYPVEKATWVFGGIEAGIAQQSTDIATEADKSGLQYGPKALASWYWKNWVLDLGMGWYSSTIEGENAAAQTIEIETEAIYFNIVPKFRLGNFQVGPVFELVIGNDFTFNEAALLNGTADETQAMYAGLQLVYDMPIGDMWRARIGGKGTMSLNIEDRQVMAFVLDLEIGYPLFRDDGKEEIVEDEPKALDDGVFEEKVDVGLEEDPLVEDVPFVESPAPAPIVAEDPIEIVDNTQLKLRLDEAMVPFDTGDAKLKQHSREFLKDLVIFLMDHQAQWQTVFVSGHTDKRGSYSLNLDLSESRALSVEKFMTVFGVSTQKIRSEGYSYSQPISKGNSEEDYSKNRRTEISFGGVEAIEEFRNGVREIILKHQAAIPGRGGVAVEAPASSSDTDGFGEEDNFLNEPADDSFEEPSESSESSDEIFEESLDDSDDSF